MIRIRVYPQRGLGAFAPRAFGGYGFGQPTSYLQQELRAERAKNRMELRYEKALMRQQLRNMQLQMSMQYGNAGVGNGYGFGARRRRYAQALVPPFVQNAYAPQAAGFYGSYLGAVPFTRSFQSSYSYC